MWWSGDRARTGACCQTCDHVRRGGVVSDLFSAAAEERLRAQAPLAARLRPRTIDDVVGQDQLVGPGRPLRRLVEQDRLTSGIFWGPPGTGKTTLALAVAGTTKRAFEQLSAVTAGVKDVREVIERARQRLGEHGRGTILFLDEIHRFSKSQQDALLPAVEDGTLTLIGATTENPFFEVNPPLRSRSTLFRLEPLNRAAIEILIARGLEAEGTTASPEAVAHLADRAAGDGRQVLTALEVACALATPGSVTLDHVEAALGTSALRYGRDDHYDVISAFIKSMRGSDPQATVHYLARMLEAGEDARFIARRMIIFASEDVGMADPQALVVAVAASQALDHVGLPEAQLNLSQAAIHLATAPKSNRAALAIWNARSEVQAGAVGEVPVHLRDAHYEGAKSLGHGTGYDYPHDHPGGFVDQQYLPIEQAGKQYYVPTDHGAEHDVAVRMRGRGQHGTEQQTQ
jgi:putative ATPase